MYNAQGIQQTYNVQGTPMMYTPSGRATPYKTPPLSKEIYSAQGSTIQIEEFTIGGAAYVSQDAKKKYWDERSVNGFPVGASESENKAEEKYAWVDKSISFSSIEPQEEHDSSSYEAYNIPSNFRASTEREQKIYEKPAELDNRSINTENKGCFYTTDGEVSCP